MSIVPPLMVRFLWLRSRSSCSCTYPDVSPFLSVPVPPLAAQQKPRDSSVEVRSDWEVKEEMDFPRLMKMRYLEVSEPQDMWVPRTALCLLLEITSFWKAGAQGSHAWSQCSQLRYQDQGEVVERTAGPVWFMGVFICRRGIQIVLLPLQRVLWSPRVLWQSLWPHYNKEREAPEKY